MSEPTKKEMLRCLDCLLKGDLREVEGMNEGEDAEVLKTGKAIRRLIKNMGKKVSREFVVKIQNILLDVAEHNTGVVLAMAKIEGMLTELGLEVDEEER